LHENLDLLKDLDVKTFIISGDTPEQQLELYNALEENHGTSLPFVSDPDFKIIDLFDMKEGETPLRGYGLLDTDGHVTFKKADDYWGEQLPETMEVIQKELKKLN
jgi:peroxiredoxin